MAEVTGAEVREQLALDGAGDHDDALIEQKIEAAQAHLERLLGFTLAEKYTDEGADVPEPLREAIMQLAAWWYEQREAAVIGDQVRRAPFSVAEIAQEYREWSF